MLYGGNPVKKMEANVLNMQHLTVVISLKYDFIAASNVWTAKTTPTVPFADIL